MGVNILEVEGYHADSVIQILGIAVDRDIVKFLQTLYQLGIQFLLMSLDLIEANLLKDLDGFAQTYDAGIVRRTCLVAGGCILIALPVVGNDIYGSAAVELGHIFIHNFGKSDQCTAAIGRIHFMGGECQKVDILLRSSTYHGEFTVSDDLRTIHDDLCAILMSQLGDAVNVIHIAGDIGCGSYGDIFYFIRLQLRFDILVFQASLLVYVGIYHIGAFSPGQEICMMLHPGGEDRVALILDQCGGKLVQTIGGGIGEDTGILSIVGTDEFQYLFPCLFHHLCGMIRFLGVAPPDGAIHVQLLIYGVLYGLQRGRCRGIVKIDLGTGRSVSQGNGLIEADHFITNAFNGVFRLALNGCGCSSFLLLYTSGQSCGKCHPSDQRIDHDLSA